MRRALAQACYFPIRANVIPIQGGCKLYLRHIHLGTYGVRAKAVFPVHQAFWHAIRTAASGPNLTDGGQGNRFLKQLSEFAWLENQRKECLQIRQALDALAGAADKESEGAVADLYSRLEQLQSTLETQEAQKKKVSEEFEKDREEMEKWFRLAGLGNTSAKFAMEHTVQKGFESATLYRLTQRDMRDCPRLTAPEVEQVLKRASEQMDKSAEKLAQQRQKEWQETKRKILIRVAILMFLVALWGIYLLFTSPKPKAVMSIIRNYRPDLPEMYVPRDDVEAPIIAALHKVDPTRLRYTLVLGPSGSGKSSALQYSCRRQKGVFRVNLTPETSEEVAYQTIAASMGLLPDAKSDFKRYVKDVLWWVSKLTRQPPAVILDVYDRPSTTASAVQQVAQQLAATCAVFVCMTPTAYADLFIKDDKAVIHWVRDLNDSEAEEALNKRRSEVEDLKKSIGLRPGLLRKLTYQTAEDIVKEAKNEISALVTDTPAIKGAMRLLAAAPYEEGVPLSVFLTACRKERLPYSPLLAYDATGNRVVFMSQAYHTAAHQALCRKWWQLW